MAGKRGARAESGPIEPTCVKYTGGWSGSMMVIGTPATDLHLIEGDLATRLIETGAYEALGEHSHDAEAAASEVVVP